MEGSGSYYHRSFADGVLVCDNRVACHYILNDE